jgi:hypothetical protein
VFHWHYSVFDTLEVIVLAHIALLLAKVSTPSNEPGYPSV